MPSSLYFENEPGSLLQQIVQEIHPTGILVITDINTQRDCGSVNFLV